MTAADLALVVHASRSFRRSSQLMPTAGIGRCRVSALDLAIRLRTERRVMVLEPEVFEMLRALAERGCVDRGDDAEAAVVAARAACEAHQHYRDALLSGAVGALREAGHARRLATRALIRHLVEVMA